MINKLNDENTYKLIKLVGNFVKIRRLQKNISQIELSHLSGISPNAITRFETGRGNITLYSLINILKALDMVDVLSVAFSAPTETPSMQAKAARKKPVQQRVRRTKVKTDKNSWSWKEDKK